MINPFRLECFHQVIDENIEIIFSYRAVHGSELTTNFLFILPNNMAKINDRNKEYEEHTFKTEARGEYRFCFGNPSKSEKSHIQFQFHTLTEFTDPEHEVVSTKEQLFIKQLEYGAHIDLSVDSFHHSSKLIHDNLESAKTIQTLFKAFERIDTFLMGKQLERVNFWSAVNICIMLVVGVIQVIMIRSLFEERSKLGKVLRGNKSKVERGLGY